MELVAQKGELALGKKRNDEQEEKKEEWG